MGHPKCIILQKLSLHPLTYALIYTCHCNLICAEQDKTNKITCVLSKDSDEPLHPPSLITVFAVHSEDSQGPKASCGHEDW